jgi:CheY-like chemotaxis protein
MVVKSLNGKKILVVEDEPSISTVCERVLASEGGEVEIAVNGKIAQDMIQKKRYDFCLIDIRTPTMNGKELHQWLAEKHPRLADGVVFTTGDVMDEDIQSLLKRTDRPFLPKPFAPDDLRAIMKEALGRL